MRVLEDIRQRASLDLLRAYNRQLASPRLPSKQAERIKRNREILIKVLREQGILPTSQTVTA